MRDLLTLNGALNLTVTISYINHLSGRSVGATACVKMVMKLALNVAPSGIKVSVEIIRDD